MYKKFFGLAANPFNVNPDPRFLFLTRYIREALACLTYGVQTRKGFVLLSGEVGTGKTTLLNKFLQWLHVQRTPTAFMFNPRLTVPEFFSMMMNDFGIPCDGHDKSKVLMALNDWLLQRYRAGETAVLIVDEAQTVSNEVLEEIRLLTNLETSTEKLLQIVLSGQPELEHRLKDAQLRQLRQRITLRCRTCPLTREETHSYVAQRLRIAGSDGAPIFSPESLDAIFHYARGVPRVINLLCEHALIGVYVDQVRTVSAGMIESIAREFELDDASPMGWSDKSDSTEAGGHVMLVNALRKIGTAAPQSSAPGYRRRDGGD